MARRVPLPALPPETEIADAVTRLLEGSGVVVDRVDLRDDGKGYDLRLHKGGVAAHFNFTTRAADDLIRCVLAGDETSHRFLMKRVTDDMETVLKKKGN